MSAPPPLPPKQPPLPPVRPTPTLLRPANPGHFVMSPRITLDPLLITGKSIGIFGTNGSGKSGTTRKLAEEHIAKGLDKYPFTIADIENEFATLKELGEIFIAGIPVDYGAIKIDIELHNAGEYYELGRRAFQENLSIVLLLGDLSDDNRKEYLQQYLDGMFQAANDPTKAHYYRVFIEEAQEYVPQSGGGPKSEDPLKQTIIRFAKRGRKRKLSLVITSQRPANISKDVISQAHILILHFVTYPTDLNLYESSTGFNIENAREKCMNMKPGDCIFVFGKSIVEDRITRPITISPWDEGTSLDVSKFMEVHGAEELQSSIITEGKNRDEGTSIVSTAYIHGLERKIPELESQITDLVETQIRLEEQVQSLKSKTRVSTGNIDTDALLEKNRELQNQVNEMQAHSMLITMLRETLLKN